MNKNVQNDVCIGLRLIALCLAMFFVVLAVFDGYEEVEKAEYVGEFVQEADFDFVDFPTSISRPSGSASLKLQRVAIVKIFDQLLSFIAFEPPFLKKATSIELNVPIHSIIFFIQHAVCTNAP